MLARNEFWAKVRRGALFKAAAVLVAGMAIGILLAWGLLELFPGSLERDDRLPYAINRVSGFVAVSPENFDGHPHVFLNAHLRPVRRAGADGRRDRAVPVPARRECARG